MCPKRYCERPHARTHVLVDRSTAQTKQARKTNPPIELHGIQFPIWPTTTCVTNLHRRVYQLCAAAAAARLADGKTAEGVAFVCVGGGV